MSGEGNQNTIELSKDELTDAHASDREILVQKPTTRERQFVIELNPETVLEYADCSDSVERYKLRVSLRALFGGSKENKEENIDQLVSQMEQWMHSGNFANVDKIFALLNEELFRSALNQLDIPLTLLMATNAGRAKEMTSRQKFVEHLQDKIQNQRDGNADRLYLDGFK